MGSIITVSITGYVGSEPQLRQVGDQRVASFSVAINRTTSNGNQQTLWVRAKSGSQRDITASQPPKNRT
ncbi:MAG: hypothetical protein AAFN11_01575 [Chloroflexota bacterium]